jgi:excisionase family DNA binding protein
MESDVMSIPDAAKVLGVSERTVHTMIDRHELEAKTQWKGRQRRRWVIRESLEAYQAAQRRQASEA